MEFSNFSKNISWCNHKTCTSIFLWQESITSLESEIEEKSDLIKTRMVISTRIISCSYIELNDYSQWLFIAWQMFNCFFKILSLIWTYFFQPTFEELEKNFKRKTTDFDEMKKYIVGMMIIIRFCYNAKIISKSITQLLRSAKS